MRPEHLTVSVYVVSYVFSFRRYIFVCESWCCSHCGRQCTIYKRSEKFTSSFM